MTPPYNGLKSLPVQSEGSSSLCGMFMFRGIYSQFPSVNPPNTRMLTLSLFLIHLHSLPMSAQWQSKARFSKMITKLDRWAATWHFFFPLHENVRWFSLHSLLQDANIPTLFERRSKTGGLSTCFAKSSETERKKKQWGLLQVWLATTHIWLTTGFTWVYCADLMD